MSDIGHQGFYLIPTIGIILWVISWYAGNVGEWLAKAAMVVIMAPFTLFIALLAGAFTIIVGFFEFLFTGSIEGTMKGIKGERDDEDHF